MTNTIEIDAPGVDIGLTLRPLAMLAGDPTIRVGGNFVERATITPDGPGTIRTTWMVDSPRVQVAVFGDGARWLQERAPQFLGIHDDASSFTPEEPVVRRLWLHFRGDRVARTETLWHDLAWTITQQRVRRADAARQWRRLVESFGEVAPGIDSLRTPPDTQRMARVPATDLRRLGFDAQRAAALTCSAVVASRLQRFVDGSVEEARGPFLAQTGIGPWTFSCLSAFTWGDPDTVIVGDSGIPSLISEAVTGERRADDARMLEILDAYRPHRYRVLKLAFASRLHRSSYR